MAKRAPGRVSTIIKSRPQIKKDPMSRSILGGTMVGSSGVVRNRRTITTERTAFGNPKRSKSHVQKKYTTVRGKKHLPRATKRNGMTKRAYRKGAKIPKENRG
jgi:hypothetical protein